MASSTPLTIIIVGAGIGGLAASIAFRQQGHKVIVLEKSKLKYEIGAAIALQPNCTALLRQLGVEPEDIGATILLNMSVKDSRTLKDVGEMSDKVKEATVRPAPCKETNNYLIHRADLHNALQAQAVSCTNKGLPVDLWIDSAVQDVSPCNATVTLKDGRSVAGDVIIAADGVHSVCRKLVLGKGVRFQEVPSPVSCFRTLIPTALLRDDPNTQHLVKDAGAVTEVASLDRRVIFYPCSGGDMINVLATLPRQLGGWSENGWDKSSTRREKLLAAYIEFADPIRRMLEKTTEEGVTAWELFDLDPLPQWTEGAMALMGDAAHPFSPFLAQGASQALEDAMSLSVMLPLGTPTTDIPERLRWYEACRKDRATKIQEYSRMRGRESSGQRGKPPSGDEIMHFIMYIIMHNESANSAKFYAEKRGLE